MYQQRGHTSQEVPVSACGLECTIQTALLHGLAVEWWIRASNDGPGVDFLTDDRAL